VLQQTEFKFSRKRYFETAERFKVEKCQWILSRGSDPHRTFTLSKEAGKETNVLATLKETRSV
jgi:hypothetical protein